jgi:hypothetical protein
MRKIFLIVFSLQYFAFPQSDTFNFHSPENIKLFADYLFCEKDYLRAIEEYEQVKAEFNNDTIDFKIIAAYSNLGLYEESNEYIDNMNISSAFYPDAYLLSMKNDLISYEQPLKHKSLSSFNLSQNESFNRISVASTLYDIQPIYSKKDFLINFDDDDQKVLSRLYEYKFDPPYRSPALAGLFSAIIPGSGKMYLGEWGDGISGLLLTGLFAFLAYDNFKNDHDTRAWIFTGIGAFFYAGNIYGSVAAAQIFNAKINFEFENGLKLFLESENYFLPDYDFCK